MDLEFWATTDVGRVRDHNEDNFLVDKRMKLFVVCDGMGGHAAGEIASAMSVRVVREVMSGHREVFNRLAQDPDNLANRKSVLNLVEHAIQEACLRVYQAAQEDKARQGMGTTCSLLLLAQGRGFIGHVGDSRIYLYRQGGVHQITEDHSLINEMIRLGKIKKGEEHNLPHKNAVTRAVGVNEFVEVDTFELDVFGGDAFLLCSDGLSGYFNEDSDITSLLDLEDVREVTEQAIDFANSGGGKDNITAIAVRVTSDDIHTRDIQRTLEVMRATPFFQYLAYKEMVQMVNLSKRREVATGDAVFDAGSDPGALFLVVRGQVRLEREGREIGVLYPGDYFGETALIDDTPLAYSAASASDDTVVLAFPRARFMELLRGEPDLAVKLLWNFVQTFTARLRPIPYETFLGDRVDEVDEPTPPSGTLVFERDQNRHQGHRPSSVSGEFVPPEEVVEAARAEASTNDDASGSGALAGHDPNKTVPPGADPSTTAPMKQKSPPGAAGAQASSGAHLSSAAQASSGAGEDPDEEDLAWDEIVPENVLDSDPEVQRVRDDELRETMQMDRDELDEDPRRSVRDTHPDISTDSEGGESEAEAENSSKSEKTRRKRPTPQAQVLKRTKLVVGGENFDDNERTREVKPLRERTKARRDDKDADATMEIDADENIEERS